jgi:hypothetical protein
MLKDRREAVFLFLRYDASGVSTNWRCRRAALP